MGLGKFIKKCGKYVIKKLSTSVVGRAVNWTFCTLLCFYGPGPIIATIGIRGLILAAVATQSNIIGYSTSKIVDRYIPDEK